MADVNVLNYGAVANNPTFDNAPKFAAAIAAANTGSTGPPYVYVPSGKWFFASSISITIDNLTIEGAGPGTTTLAMANTSSPIFNVNIPASSNFLVIANMSLSRENTNGNLIATAGGNGITMSSALVNCYIYNLEVVYQYIGLSLASVSYGIVQNVIVANGQSHGFSIINSPTNGMIQWSLINTIAEGNSGYGYYVTSTGTPTLAPTMNPWIYVYSYLNNMGGIIIESSSTTNPLLSINDFSIFGAFCTGDNGPELTLDTFGTYNRVMDSFFENAGTLTTGPYPPSKTATHLGQGISLKNNTDVLISGCSIVTNSQDGIDILGVTTGVTPEVSISGCRIISNGVSMTGTYSGMAISLGVYVSVVGCRIGTASGAVAVQKYGIQSADGSKLSVVGCNLLGNTTAPVIISAALYSATISGNSGYLGRNGGAVTIAATQTSIVVNHGLGAIPLTVNITPTGDLGSVRAYVNSPTATTFTINLSSAFASTSVTFYWTATLFPD